MKSASFVASLLWIGSIAFFVFGEDVTIDLGTMENRENFSHCDCEGIKNSSAVCLPDCVLFCGLTGAFWQAGDFFNEQCREGAQSPIPILQNETGGLLGLRGIFRDATEKITQLIEEAPIPENKAGCEDCSPTVKIHNMTQPRTFEQDSCDEQYIRTHYFRHRVTKPVNAEGLCANKQRQQIFQELQDYSQHLLANEGDGSEETVRLSEELYDKCPSGCSFYTGSTISINMGNCSGQIDMHVNCNHERHSDWNADYVANIYLERGLQCLPE